MAGSSGESRRKCPPAGQEETGRRSLLRHRRGNRVRPERGEEKGDTGKETGLVFDISPTTGFGTVLDEPDSAVFMFFDITDGELRF